MSDQPQLATTGSWGWLAVAIVGLVAAGWLLATTTSTTKDSSDSAVEAPAMLAVAPGGSVELASLPAEHQAMYRAAADDPDGFEAVACHCGCEAFLDHRHLLDCFVRADGGWERHATGCAVCLAEAGDVVELRAAGTPISDIVQRIDERYGAITDLTT